MGFSTTCLAKHPHNQARLTQVTTAHGTFTTPTFMPVATRAFVNHMTPQDLSFSGAQIILGGNTYHMLCAPGMEVIRSAGGMHAFMDWQGPMLTDSGGFQVFSLSKNKKCCKIDEDGARFKHPVTGQWLALTPEISLRTQKTIGADIIMAFDQCTPDVADEAIVRAAMEKTHRWLHISKDFHDQHPNADYGYPQALFGIIQGGFYRSLREESANTVLSLDLDGIAIGGESIGFDMEKTRTILQWLAPLLPANKTRYAMGVGLHPQDLIDVVANGVDIFDCVAPTRNARHGALYHGSIVKKDQWITFKNGEDKGRLLIKKSRYAKDERPLMEDCTCYTCQHYTRSYLHYVFKQNASLYYQLACIHNVSVMEQVCEAMQGCLH